MKNRSLEGKCFKLNQHLLEWINQEQQAIEPQAKHINKFTQANEVGVISRIMSKIIQNQYDEIMTVNEIYSEINQYMNECKKSKISIQLKKKLLGVDPWPSIVRMLIYMSIHCRQKKQYIKRILCLSENHQKSIMSDIQDIEQNMKQIQQKECLIIEIQKLQEENQLLKEMIGQVQKENTNLKDQFQFYKNQADEERIQKQALQRQKQEILNKFHINCSSDFQGVYDIIYNDNELLSKEIVQLKILNNRLQNENYQIKQTTKYQTQVIAELNTELQQISFRYTSVMQGTCQYDMKQSGQQNIQSKLLSTLTSQKFKKSSLSMNRLAMSSKSSAGFFAQTKTGSFLSKIEGKVLMKQQVDRYLKEKEELEEIILENDKSNEYLKQENDQLLQKIRRLQDKSTFYSKKLKTVEKIYHQLVETFPFSS